MVRAGERYYSAMRRLVNRTPVSKRIIARLPAGRVSRPREDALADIAAGLPLGDAAELADLLEIELGMPIGLLVPDDSLGELLAPFGLGNPFTWLFAEGRLEDGIGEVAYQLRRRRNERGWATVGHLSTIRDLFLAWCRP